MLRSVEDLSNVKLRAGATSRFFLTVAPVRARLVGGTSVKKEKERSGIKQVYIVYTLPILLFKVSKKIIFSYFLAFGFK